MKAGIRVLVALAIWTPLAFAQTLRITKIDPPNWWAGMPDPMLLIYGEGLKDAKFSVVGTGVMIDHEQTSENGHYAFLWLTGKDASPQTLQITATGSGGSAKASYELKKRLPAEGRYSGFSSVDVMYLIMTDRFADGDPSNDQPGYDLSQPRGWHGGDLRGVEQHLDYMQSLGVTTLWTTPVDSNAGMRESYHGYAAVDLYAVDPHFGTLADYQHLASSIHERGMKIVFDIVPNHIGMLHPWVKDPPTPDWLHGTLAEHVPVKYNFEALVDPHASPAASYNITHGWFTDGMPDLNQENPLVSQYLIQNAMWWIETIGLDGLRIDTFSYVGRQFWQDFHRALRSVYPHLTTVGEVFNGDPTITSFFAGGIVRQGIDTGLYTPFDFPVYFTLRDVLVHDKPMTALTDVMRQDRLYPHPERLVFFFGNHDTKRFLSEPGATPEKLKLAFGLLATLRGMPEIYSGDEIGMKGGDDPDNRHDFPGGFPGQTENAFNSTSRTPEEQAIFDWTSGLFKVRAQNDALKTGAQQTLFVDDTSFAFLRTEDIKRGCSPGPEERVFVVLNKSAETKKIDIAEKDSALEHCTQFQPLFPAEAPAVTLVNGTATVTLPANGFAEYRVH